MSRGNRERGHFRRRSAEILIGVGRKVREYTFLDDDKDDSADDDYDSDDGNAPIETMPPVMRALRGIGPRRGAKLLLELASVSTETLDDRRGAKSEWETFSSLVGQVDVESMRVSTADIIAALIYIMGGILCSELSTSNLKLKSAMVGEWTGATLTSQLEGDAFEMYLREANESNEKFGPHFGSGKKLGGRAALQSATQCMMSSQLEISKTAGTYDLFSKSKMRQIPGLIHDWHDARWPRDAKAEVDVKKRNASNRKLNFCKEVYPVSKQDELWYTHGPFLEVDDQVENTTEPVATHGAPDDRRKECASCGVAEREGTDAKSCFKCECKLVYYCSKECQKKHWPEHKARCKKARK